MESGTVFTIVTNFPCESAKEKVDIDDQDEKTNIEVFDCYAWQDEVSTVCDCDYIDDCNEI